MGIEHRLHSRCAGLAGLATKSTSHERGPRRRKAVRVRVESRHFERARPFRSSTRARPRARLRHKSVRGSATLRLRRVDPEPTTIELDAVGFGRDRRVDRRKRRKYTYDGAKLVVPIAPEGERADPRRHLLGDATQGPLLPRRRRARARRARARCGRSARTRTRATSSLATTSRTSR